MSLFYIADIQIAFWTVATVAAVLLFRRFRGVSTVLLIIGAAGLVAENVIMSLATHDWPLRHAIELYPTAFNTVDHLLTYYVALCFPIGFLWFALRVRRA